MEQCKGSAERLENAVKAFILDRRIRGCSPASLDAYRYQLMPSVRWCAQEAVDLPGLSESHVRAFLLYRQEVSQATLAAAALRLKTFFKWCAAEEISPDFARRIQRPRVAQKVVHALSVAQLRAMLKFCSATTFQGKRDEALIRFMVDTGTRISEVLTLPKERLDLDGGSALVNGKGAKQRIVFFGAKTTRALLKYLAARDILAPRSPIVFLNGDGSPMNRRHAHQTIARLGRRAGIEGVRVSPHTLRHTSALMFLRAGGDALTLQRLLGHTTLAMTRRYVNEETADLEAAHRRSGPGDLL